MKCRAEETVREQRLSKVTRLYGTLCLEAIQAKAAMLLVEKYPWFRMKRKTRGEGDRMKLFFDAQAAAVERELNENAADNVWVTDRRGRHRADNAERFEVVTDDAEYRLTRLLAYGGINAGRVLALAEAYAPDRDPKGQEGLHMEARIAWYAWLGKRAAKTWIAAAGLALLDMRFPSGGRRFPIRSVEEDFIIPLAEFTRDWMERFMDVQDKALTAEQRFRTEHLQNGYSIELVSAKTYDLWEQGGEQPRTNANLAEEKSAKSAPEEYERIFAEVGRGFRRMGGTP